MAASALPRIQRDIIREILRQLRAAELRIIAAMRAVTEADRARRLARQRAEILRTIEVFRAAASSAALGGLDSAWDAGAAAIRAQVAAGASAGIAVAGRINARVLLAMRDFMTDRISDVSRQAIDKINTALAQHLLGVQSLSDTITQIQRVLGGATRRRAMTIAYTEVGRAYSAAQYEQMLAQAKVLPGLKKRWLHSGKDHPRPGHVLCASATKADPIPVAEPFEIVDLKTGAIELLRYPRDPNASAANVINCGCDMVAVPPPADEYVPLTPADLVRPGVAAVVPPPRVVRDDAGLLAALERATAIRAFAARASAPQSVRQALLVMGDTPGAFAAELQRLGHRARSRRLGLDHDNTRHLLRSHGQVSEQLRGQEPITADDLVLIPQLLAGDVLVVPGDPPKARDGAALVQVAASHGAFDYTIVLKIRAREIVPYTMFKRRRK